MKVRAFLKTYIIPDYAEDVRNGLDYAEDLIPIMITDLTNTKDSKEFFKGLKQEEVSKVVKVEKDKFDNMIIEIKPYDIIIIFGQEYQVVKVDERITNERFASKIARNNNLYDRYVERMVVLK